MSAVTKKLYQNYRDKDWLRESFFQFTPKALYGANFREWYKMGGWNEHYIPYSFVDHTTMLANVSISKMELLINGVVKKGIQFATVGTLPEYRKQGLAKELMQFVLSEYEHNTDVFFLFANDSVLDFYPKFGFTKVEEVVFSATISKITPCFNACTLNLYNAADFILIQDLCRNRMPITQVFGAINYWHILLFYLPHYTIYYLEKEQIIVIATIEEDTLHIYDIISNKAFSFQEIVPFIIEKPLNKIFFYFTPDNIDLPTAPGHVYTDSPLFVKGDFTLKEKPFKFPLLAQT